MSVGSGAGAVTGSVAGSAESVPGPCRLCLGEGAVLRLFGAGSKVGARVRIYCRIRVREDDGLPQFVCSACAFTLDRFSHFAAICRHSDRALRSFMQTPSFTPDGFSNLQQVSLEAVPKTELRISLDSVKQEVDLDFIDYEQPLIGDDFQCDNDEIKQETIVKTEKKPNEEKIKKKRRKKTDKAPFFLCPICGEEIQKSNNFSAHMKRHMGIKDFPCSICGKGFASKHKRNEHELIHGNIKNFSCDICKKEFLTRHAVNRHMKLVHLKSHQTDCKICGKRLCSKSSVDMHMKTHTGQRDFECDTCGKKFTSKYTITSHIRTHSGEKPYACRFCSSRFSHNRTWVDHERLHKGETPHKCPVCDKGFAQRGNMKSHYRYNHKDAEPIK